MDLGHGQWLWVDESKLLKTKKKKLIWAFGWNGVLKEKGMDLGFGYWAMDSGLVVKWIKKYIYISTRLIDQHNKSDFTNPKLTSVLQLLFFLTFQPSLKIRLFKIEILTWHKIPGHYILPLKEISSRNLNELTLRIVLSHFFFRFPSDFFYPMVLPPHFDCRNHLVSELMFSNLQNP